MLTICVMSKTVTILFCSGIFLILLNLLILFGMYSLGSGKIISFSTLGEGKV